MRSLHGHILLLVLAAVVAMVGCERQEVPQVLGPEQRAKLRTRKTETTPTRAPVRRVLPAAAPRIMPRAQQEAKPRPGPITIMATEMRADVGTSDTEGGWQLNAAGALWVDNLKLEQPVKAILIEAKGQPSAGVWPNIDFGLFERSTQKNAGGWKRDFITSSTYVEYYRDMERPIPAGEYVGVLRFHNNSAKPLNPDEDRNVWVRKIVLYAE